MENWQLYPKPAETKEFKFSWIAILAFYILVIGGALAIRTLTWPEGKPVDTFLFLIQAVVAPFMIISTMLGYIFMLAQSDVYFRDCKKSYYDWRLYNTKVYARKYLVIADWSSVTPVKDIALQMLKLEGEFPLAPKTPLIIGSGEEFETTKAQQILTKLIAPLSEKLKKYPGFDVTFGLQGVDETISDGLIKIFQEQGIVVGNPITCLTECPDYSLLNKMITESERHWNYRHLLIIIDLHNDEESKFMENASALFICNDYPQNERPKPVFLFQPLTSDQDLSETTPVFIDTQPSKPQKTLWHTGLSQSEKYPLFSVLGEKNVAAQRLELDLSLGEHSAGYGWLALVIASDAIRYAQGPQLVAASEKNKPGIVALSSEQPPKLSTPDIDDYAIRPVAIALVAAFLAVFGTLLGWIAYVGVPDYFWLIIFDVLVIIISGVIGWKLTVAAQEEAYDAISRSHC